MLAATVLLLGGGAYWCAWGLGLVALVLAVTWRAEWRESESPIAGGLLLASIVSGAALVPLPLRLVSSLAPQIGAFWSDLPPPHPAWVAWSLDRGATALEAVKWATYAWIAALAARHTRQRGLEDVFAVVGLVGLGAALLSLAHLLIGAQTVLGVYRPLSGNRALGPIINSNHLASLCNLATFCWLGLLLGRARSRIPRIWHVLGVATCALMTVVSASRGGVISLLVGMALLGLALIVRRPVSLRALGPLIVLILGVALGFLGLSDASSKDLFNPDLSKIHGLATLSRPILDHPILGVGRGAFDATSQYYVSSDFAVILRSIECFALSWLVEWGAIVGGLALLLLTLALSPFRLRVFQSLRATLGYIGVMTVLLQNLLDIGLELPAVTAPLWAVLAALDASRFDRGAPTSRVLPAFGHLLRPAVVGGCLVLGLAASAALGPAVFQERHRLYSLFRSKAPTFAGEALAATRRYPSEPYFWQLLSELEVRQGRDSLPSAARALVRAPKSGRVHWLVARGLVTRGALRQALRHLAWAVSYDISLAPDAAALAVRLSHGDPELLRLAIPDRHASKMLLPFARSLDDAKFAVERRELIHEAIRREPWAPEAHWLLGYELLRDLTTNTEPCVEQVRCALRQRSNTYRSVEGQADAIDALDLGRCGAVQLRAALLETDGKFVEAEELLGRSCHQCYEILSCERDRVRMADQTGEQGRIRRAESGYLGAACSDDASCLNANEWLGRRALDRKDWLEARRYLTAVVLMRPSAQGWLGLAEAHARLGDLERGQEALTNARALGAADGRVEALLQAAREEALRRVLRP